mmetsp:Transcript_28741/g.60467  ORF Transcript_28741/g.60467 Transcript_28741/m.60467 type:complete len:100 (+) Transcript_28741:221-520(+)
MSRVPQSTQDRPVAMAGIKREPTQSTVEDGVEVGVGVGTGMEVGVNDGIGMESTKDQSADQPAKPTKRTIGLSLLRGGCMWLAMQWCESDDRMTAQAVM